DCVQPLPTSIVYLRTSLRMWQRLSHRAARLPRNRRHRSRPLRLSALERFPTFEVAGDLSHTPSAGGIHLQTVFDDLSERLRKFGGRNRALILCVKNRQALSEHLG